MSPPAPRHRDRPRYRPWLRVIIELRSASGNPIINRLRVASLQYFIRPRQSFAQFRDQVVGLVDTAADYGARLVVFPEYFTL